MKTLNQYISRSLFTLISVSILCSCQKEEKKSSNIDNRDPHLVELKLNQVYSSEGFRFHIYDFWDYRCINDCQLCFSPSIRIFIAYEAAGTKDSLFVVSVLCADTLIPYNFMYFNGSDAGRFINPLDSTIFFFVNTSPYPTDSTFPIAKSDYRFQLYKSKP